MTFSVDMSYFLIECISLNSTYILWLISPVFSLVLDYAITCACFVCLAYATCTS